MNKLKRMILFGLLATVCMAAPAAAQDDKKGTAAEAAVEKNKYQNVEVVTFTAQDEVKMTEEQLKALTDTVVKELREIKKFKQVTREGEAAAPATAGATSAGETAAAVETAAADTAPTLRITGTVVKFKAGSRAKRYFIGFGAGKSKMIANVKYIDRATGQVLYEYVADGDVHMGIFGGDSGGVKSELAEQVAKYAKKKFF